jgi:hypothetical protein
MPFDGTAICPGAWSHPASAHLPDGLTLSYLILDRAGSTHSPRAIETSCDASHCSASNLREKWRACSRWFASPGYDYPTRQVGASDATEKGHVGLAAYYTERVESPGIWVGSGMDGIGAGDPVTAEQMRNLFGHGQHRAAGRKRGGP